MYRPTTSARTLALLGALLSLSAAAPEPARGGCGCDKPPPPPAQVRPGIAYAGTPVTLFSPAFVVGDAYTVTFTSGTTGQTMSVSGDHREPPGRRGRAVQAAARCPAALDAARTGDHQRDARQS